MLNIPSKIIFKSPFNQFICRALSMKIGTHSGTFHCDEALACFLLKQLPEYKDAEIVRTRDLNLLNECDVVVDVGGKFNHEEKKYDHHQREFQKSLSDLRPEFGNNNTIRLSSAGLIYTYYGERVIELLSPEIQKDSESKIIIYKKLYKNFIEELDAIDNGIPMTDTEPRYKIRTDISSRVGRLNPRWNETNKKNCDELFKEAMKMVGNEFLYFLKSYTTMWLPARDIVKEALQKRFMIHDSGAIIELKSAGAPWKEHLFDLEEELKMEGVIKFAIFKDDSWRVQAVPVTPSSFVLRKPLKKDWHGLNDDELSKKANIEGCVFCHSTGFIGGNRTREGAIEMAIQTLNG